jgi:GNAT superfamily N-acetyltransferase
MIASDELYRQLIASDAAFTIARLGVIANRPGNPMHAVFHSEDGIHAFACRGIANPGFNRVIGLSETTADRVASLVAWLDAQGSRGRIEVLPGWHGPRLARELGAHGWTFTASTAIAAVAPDGKPPQSKVRVERVETPAAMDLFLETHLAGWGMPQSNWRTAKENMTRWLGLDGWTMLLARVDGIPAASGVLHVADRVAYLADAATRPQLRNRGAHTALLQHRLKLAEEAGCDVAWSAAAFPSTSFRNMRRAGMSLVANVSVWERGG